MTTKTVKAVSRETSESERDRGRSRNWIIVVGPGNLVGFRLKGTRRTYETTVGACAALARRQWAVAERNRKAAKKAAW